jgi:hypothetical protein
MLYRGLARRGRRVPVPTTVQLVRKDLALPRPEPHEADVPQDRVQPSTHRCRLAHRVYLPQGHHEGVVNGVLGLGTVAQDAEGLSVQRRPVAFEQYPQARRVPPCAARTRSASLTIRPLSTRRPLSKASHLSSH